MSPADFILRSELSTLKPYNAGLSLEDVAEQAAGKPIAKLASNENPYPVAKSVTQAMGEALDTAFLYPDPQGRAIASAVSERFGCHPDQVILGNGSEDILNILARAILRSGDEVVTLYPSFPLHEDYATMMGATITPVGLTQDREIDVDALVAAVSRPVRLTIFANPMNPAGLWLSHDEMARILAAQHPDSILCIDEAYFEYASGRDKGKQAAGKDYGSVEGYFRQHDKPLLLLRTFSKAYGLAGLRIGYGVTNNTTLRRGLDLVRTPFNVNAIAQAGALAALENPEAISAVVAMIDKERQRMSDALNAKGVITLPSLGNFLFLDTGKSSADVADRLIREGVIVKPWKQTGYESWLRVSIGLEKENSQFLAAIEHCLG